MVKYQTNIISFPIISLVSCKSIMFQQKFHIILCVTGKVIISTVYISTARNESYYCFVKAIPESFAKLLFNRFHSKASFLLEKGKSSEVSKV